MVARYGRIESERATPMTTIDMAAGTRADRTGLLRFALRLDALASGASAVALLAGGAVLDGPLGIPTSVLALTGAALVAWAAAVRYVGSRPRISRPAVRAVIGFNI